MKLWFRSDTEGNEELAFDRKEEVASLFRKKNHRVEENAFDIDFPHKPSVKVFEVDVSPTPK